MATKMAARRMHRELQLLSRGGAAPGISAWPRDDASRLDLLDAEICGAADTPYEGGVFRLELHIPSEYPLKPPRVRFVTRIYHPNIDTDGRICLDTLTMPPKGAWKPSLNIATLLTTIQALMSSPNPDDGLMVDITDEYRQNPVLFRNKARQWTHRYAMPMPVNASASAASVASAASAKTLLDPSPSSHVSSAAEAQTDDKSAQPSPPVESTPLQRDPQTLKHVPDTDDDDDDDDDDGIKPDTSRRLKKKPRLR